MPTKPTKWGVKVWELCESKSGYCLNLQVYTGRVAQQQLPQFGLGHRAVMDMMSPYLDRHHHLYFDRFFASPQLAEDLANRGTYSCSTVMLNRRGLPDGARKIKLMGAVQFQQKGNELLTVWKDKRQVCTLSTNSNAEMVRVGNPPKQKPVDCELQHAYGLISRISFDPTTRWTAMQEVVALHLLVLAGCYACQRMGHIPGIHSQSAHAP